MSSPVWARLGRFAIQTLRIGASTVAVVELLRQHWISAGCFGAAWLLAIQAQRLVPEAPATTDSQ